MDTNLNRRKVARLPWEQWEFIRHTLYCPDGKHFATATASHSDKHAIYEEQLRQSDLCPKEHFRVLDYDREPVVVTCYIEEREWRRGSGWFKWLRWFSKPLIKRDLSITFNTGVGPGKGSYEGGVMGAGAPIAEGETIKSAVKRFCSTTREGNARRYDLLFVRRCKAPTPAHAPAKKPKHGDQE